MKKIMLFVAVALSMSMFAKDEQKIIVQEGDLSFVKDPVLAMNVCDFSKTIIVEYTNKMEVKVVHGTFEEYNAERGEDYVKDWPNVQKSVSAVGFSKLYNPKGLLTSACTKEELALMSEKEKKTLKNLGAVLPIDKEIKYQCKITFDTIDLGSVAGAVAAQIFTFAPSDAGGCIMTGAMDVINLETNASVCTLRFRNCKGTTFETETGRMSMAMLEVFKEIVKTSKKKK